MAYVVLGDPPSIISSHKSLGKGGTTMESWSHGMEELHEVMGILKDRGEKRPMKPYLWAMAVSKISQEMQTVQM